MTISIEEVADLKKRLSADFDTVLHLHDSCGGQSFSFDKPADGTVKAFIREYFKSLGGEAQFTESDRGFTVN